MSDSELRERFTDHGSRNRKDKTLGAYLLNFIVYTAAMIGVIYAAVFVYKKSTEGLRGKSKSGLLSVEETINLAPRKTLYVVKAGNERFLIAGDVDKTSLISKLGEDGSPRRVATEPLPDIIDFQEARERVVQNFEYGAPPQGSTVFKSMAKKLS